MRCGSGMTDKRLRVSQIDQSRHKLERVMEPHRSFVTTAKTDRHQRAGTATQVLVRQAMVGAIGKSSIPNPCDARMALQEFRYAPAVLYVSFHPQSNRLDALQQEK